MRPIRRIAVLLGLAAGCFTGDELVGQPCRSDADCNPDVDARGESLACRYQVCGYQARCGDGFVDPDLEVCDLGADNRDAEYADGPDQCSRACQALPWCGDGAVQDLYETCDDGNADDTDACARCQAARCGDGFVGPGEACDPGRGPGCTPACTLPSCGDGVVQPGEACDDANADLTDDCVNCMAPVCGDGATWAGHETCDDGDADDTDECTRTCTQARCGDGLVWAGHEACDDGDDDDTDECLRTCAAATCGDRFVWAGMEVCDDGNTSQEDPCLTDCTANLCGDGFVDATAEGCEDLNDEPDDGCDACRMGAEALGGGPTSAHFCAIRGGGVRCWGHNEFGQLGLGHSATMGDDPGDLPLTGDIPILEPDTRVVAVVTGFTYTCALLDSQEVRCWGRNAYGQLGFKNDIEYYGDEPNELPDPLADIGGAVAQLAPGNEHVCAVLTTGKVRCWGDNTRAQLGYASYEESLTPPAKNGDVDLGNDLATHVTASIFHSCALLANGAVRCWGSNKSGRLGYPAIAGMDFVGDDETPGSLAPVDIGGKAEQLAAGAEHTCAVLVGGTDMVCWGRNSSAQLGNGAAGNVGDDETPAQGGVVTMLSGGDQVAALALGGQHTCVLLVGGTVRCWGAGIALGYESDKNLGGTAEKPGLVDLGGPALALAANFGSTCARLRGGVIRCWGDNASGQLGVNATLPVGSTPGSMPPVDSQIYPNPE